MSEAQPDPRNALDPEAVVAALEALRERPPPTDPSSGGCVVAVVAVLGLVSVPTLVRVTPLPAGAAPWIGGALLVALVVGAFLGVFGGGFVRGALSSELEAAVDELALSWPGGDPAALREAAVRIVDGYVVFHGPTSSTGFDRDDVSRRLGGALEYVREVERILLADELVYPCFTESGDAASGDRVG